MRRRSVAFHPANFANRSAPLLAQAAWRSVMSKAFKPEVALNGVVKIPSSVFKSLPPPAEKKSGVIGVIKRLDGTVEEVTNMSYIKSNPNFAPRKTEWGNNVTVLNKDEALIKYHERKGIPLPAELQVSGCSSRLPRASRLAPHAPCPPLPAELQASGCLLTPHASHPPHASRRLTPRASHLAPRTASLAPRALRPRPTPGQAKKVKLDAAAAESKTGVFNRLGGGRASRKGKPSGTMKPGGAFSRLAGKAIGEALSEEAPAAAAASPEAKRPPRPKGGVKMMSGVEGAVRGEKRPAAAAEEEAAAKRVA